jgi:8-oxo-dGTP pyrophosphatase MutT (NUDIX family)
MKKKYRKAVFIVTYFLKKNGKIKYLLLKRKLHWKGWEFPKGGIQKNEKAIDAVKRELKEETGLKSLQIKKFSKKGKYKYGQRFSDRKDFVGQTYSLYAAEVKKDKIKVDPLEHYKGKWFSFKRASRKLNWLNQEECLKEVNSFLENEISKNSNKKRNFSSFWKKCRKQ